jgi:hypothetical protein
VLGAARREQDANPAVPLFAGAIHLARPGATFEIGQDRAARGIE